MADEKTWQPTPNGAFTLYGVRGKPQGYTVHPNNRDKFYKAHSGRAEERTNVRGNPYLFYPQSKRGTWESKRDEEDGRIVHITLKLDGKTFWTGKVRGGAEVAEEQPDPFD